jgi:hypothetical protein
MGNRKRETIRNYFKEINRKNPVLTKEKQEFLATIEKLMIDWAKTFPKDNGTYQVLKKLYKTVEMSGVSKAAKDRFNTYLTKFNQKTK